MAAAKATRVPGRKQRGGGDFRPVFRRSRRAERFTSQPPNAKSPQRTAVFHSPEFLFRIRSEAQEQAHLASALHTTRFRGCWLETYTPPICVLIVDADPLIRWSLAETLRDSGDVVLEADNGATAVRALSETSAAVDVVLLDYQLPDVHDLSLLSTMRRRWPGSPVILMSAHATPELAEAALAMGATCVILKPIDMRDVPPLVHDVARFHPN